MAIGATVVEGSMTDRIIEAAVVAIETQLPALGDEQAPVLRGVRAVALGAFAVLHGGVNAEALIHGIMAGVA